MKRALVLLLGGCAAAASGPPPGAPPLATTDGTAPPPPLPTALGYDRGALDAARTAATTAHADAVAADGDALARGIALDHAAVRAADTTVLAGRVELLDQCARDLRGCPPTLTASVDAPPATPPTLPTEPTLAVAWARDAHAAACSCASIACVDGWTERLRQVEATAPAAATASIAIAEELTWARECLTTLRRGAR